MGLVTVSKTGGLNGNTFADHGNSPSIQVLTVKNGFKVEKIDFKKTVNIFENIELKMSNVESCSERVFDD